MAKAPKGRAFFKANRAYLEIAPKKWIDSNKLTDEVYRRALTLGVAYMIEKGEIDYATIKPN